MICPTCGRDNSKKVGWSIFKDGRNQRYQCKSCSRVWSAIGKNPKLLYFDIETAPAKVWTWGVYQRFIQPENVIDDFFVLAWAAKWVCSSSMYSYVVNSKEVKKCDDSRIIKPLWKLFNEADIIIGHNSDKFDIKKMNWRWAVNGTKPPRPYKTVDTLKAARSVWGATSNTLDFLTKSLGLNGKMATEKGLWLRCMKGDSDALRQLRKYNEVDVLEGESLYLKVRPWMKNHPNMGLYYETDTERCKNCGSTDLVIDEMETVKTAANSYFCWVCVNCGANGRTPESAIDKDKRKSLMR